MDWLINYYPESSTSGTTFDEWVNALNSKLGGKLFFLEIGAMDGVRHDALNKHILNNPGWSGLLVEPLPDMFERLKANYHNRSNLSFEQAAITEKEGTAEISRIPIEKVANETPEWADGISTLMPKGHIISEYSGLKPHIVKQSIKTMPFKKLVEKHKITDINLVQIDTEGYDKIVFDQIWQAGFRPELIKLEINYLTYKTIKDLRWMFQNNGYAAFYEGDDMIAVNI